jgi:hypothetical protein
MFAGSIGYAQTANTVTISGSVVDDSAAPVAATKVYYNNSPAMATDRAGHLRVVEPFISSSVNTGSDGKFTVTGLSRGVYWLCAEARQQNQLQSCDWGFGGTKVDLTKASSAADVKLQVHAGVTLTFQVSDARGKIKDFPAGSSGPSKEGNFRIFVVSGSVIKPADPISATAAARQYAITVPATGSFRLLVDSKLSVLNQNNAIAADGKLDDTIVISGKPVTYSLTVQ